MPVDYDRLLERIDKKEARVGIIGMGYVCLPVARSFAAGYPLSSPGTPGPPAHIPQARIRMGPALTSAWSHLLTGRPWTWCGKPAGRGYFRGRFEPWHEPV